MSRWRCRSSSDQKDYTGLERLERPESSRYFPLHDQLQVGEKKQQKETRAPHEPRESEVPVLDARSPGRRTPGPQTRAPGGQNGWQSVSAYGAGRADAGSGEEKQPDVLASLLCLPGYGAAFVLSLSPKRRKSTN